MRVLKGGSAEVKPNKWHKFDIELDESDLQAIVIKNSLNLSKLTVGQKYKILASQAEILVTMEFEAQGLNSEVSASTLTKKFMELLATMPKEDWAE